MLLLRLGLALLLPELLLLELLLPLELLLLLEVLPLLRLELLLSRLLEELFVLEDELFVLEEELLPLAEEPLSLRLFVFTPELLLLPVRPLSRLGLVVVLLPPDGLRPELDEPEFMSGRRFGVVSLFGFSSFPEVDGRPEVEGLRSESGRGRVVVPLGRV